MFAYEFIEKLLYVVRKKLHENIINETDKIIIKEKTKKILNEIDLENEVIGGK